jgi:hypothetical protein
MIEQTESKAPPLVSEYRTARGCRAELYYWHDLTDDEVRVSERLGWSPIQVPGPARIWERPEAREFAVYAEGDLVRVYAETAEQFAAERAALLSQAST